MTIRAVGILSLVSFGVAGLAFVELGAWLDRFYARYSERVMRRAGL